MTVKTISVWFLTAGAVCAEWSDIKPGDFRPLTRLPWESDSATLDSVINDIFLETNVDIRYAVLSEYLHRIPVGNFAKAFDLSLAREGVESPDNLVALILFNWAMRDPEAAWAKTQTLFKTVGIEEGWLAFDGWERQPEIFAVDLPFLRQSAFRLSRDTLLALPAGLQESALPPSERVRLMKAFLEAWFEVFDTWPGGGKPGGRFQEGHDDFGASEWGRHPIIEAFHRDPSPLISSNTGGHRGARAADEIQWRCWLAKKPDEYEKVFQSIAGTTWRAERWPLSDSLPETQATISIELLLVWRQADKPAMIQWAQRNDHAEHLQAVTTARCILMREVGPELRDQWIRELLAGDNVGENMRELAAWHPRLALESAVLVDEDSALQDLVDGIGYGPWDGYPWNTSHSGFKYLFEHEFQHASDHIQRRLLEELDATCFMEQWGSLDIPSAAKFGARLLPRLPARKLSDLTAFFEGNDDLADDGGVLDRTFCALTIWAITRPEDMRAWIEKDCPPEFKESLRVFWGKVSSSAQESLRK